MPLVSSDEEVSSLGFGDCDMKYVEGAAKELWGVLSCKGIGTLPYMEPVRLETFKNVIGEILIEMTESHLHGFFADEVASGSGEDRVS